ncbi:MAG: alkaline phosphatase family protein [Candidatus Micrarchaeota archaeon]
MKTLLIVLDGVGDLPCVELKGKTPLEAAHKPHMDALAKRAIVWNARIAKDVAPESDVGVLSILGISPFEKHYGRSIFELLSTGEEFKPGWLVARTNFCTLRGGKIVDRRAGRISTEDAKLLEKEINKIKLSVPFVFRATAGHRGVVWFKGKFSKNVQNTDPAYQKDSRGITNALTNFGDEILECVALDGKKETVEAAKIVNEFTLAVNAALEKGDFNKKRSTGGQLQANGITLRDCETELPSEDYRDWTILAGMPLEIGIGKAFQMKVVCVKEGDYTKIAQVAAREIERENVYVHLKGPDIFGHDGKPIEKKKCIEEIDEKFFGNLKVDLTKTRIIITADHSTPCKLKAHSSDTVPVLVAGEGVEGRDNFFDEKTSRAKKEIPAWEILQRAKTLVLRA